MYCVYIGTYIRHYAVDMHILAYIQEHFQGRVAWEQGYSTYPSRPQPGEDEPNEVDCLLSQSVSCGIAVHMHQDRVYGGWSQ